MAIIFQSEKYENIKIDSYMIIGVMGDDYNTFLKSLRGKIFYMGYELNNSELSVWDFINSNNNKYNIELIEAYLKDLDLDKQFLDKEVNKLSHSEQRLLKYLELLLSNASVIIVNEPFIDLDYQMKKKISALFKRLSKFKTVIIGSSNSDIIYSLCKKVLLLGPNKYTYDNVTILANKNILKRYHLVMPQIIQFIRLANDKKVHLPYSKDIRDLIKDVYKHVTK